MYTRSSKSPEPVMPTQSPPGAVQNIGQAQPFRLPKIKGGELVYEAGGGPALITLSAVGCAGCRQRVPTDAKAYTMAKKYGVPVWNIFVYANATAGAQFQAELQPAADEFVYDVDGKVSVTTYGGSDSSCWLLIDKTGNLIYRSGPDLAALEEKLKLADR